MKFETRGWPDGGLPLFWTGFYYFCWLVTERRVCVWPQIYTDWANHYLAKSGHKRLIKDLQTDVTDGVLLAEIIQVVGKENTRLITKSAEGSQLWSCVCWKNVKHVIGYF